MILCVSIAGKPMLVLKDYIYTLHHILVYMKILRCNGITYKERVCLTQSNIVLKISPYMAKLAEENYYVENWCRVYNFLWKFNWCYNISHCTIRCCSCYELCKNKEYEGCSHFIKNYSLSYISEDFQEIPLRLQKKLEEVGFF